MTSNPMETTTYLKPRLREHTNPPALQENILILGCGYVGMFLAQYWQKQGHCVTGTTTRASRIAELESVTSRVAVVTADDATRLQALFQDHDTLVVSVAPRESQNTTYQDTYVKTATTVVEALRQSPRIKQVIYLSSCSVYGDRQGQWVDEATPLDPSQRQQQALQEAETIFLNGFSRPCIFRLGGIYGPGRELLAMFAGLSGMTLPGSGDRIINWIHVDDIVSAIDFAQIHHLQGIYNLVDNSKLSIRQLTDLTCDTYGLPLAQWDPMQLIQPRRSNLRVSNQKIKAAGYSFLHPHVLV